MCRLAAMSILYVLYITLASSPLITNVLLCLSLNSALKTSLKTHHNSKIVLSSATTMTTQPNLLSYLKMAF